ncbi:MAG: NUDIX domain-containing protein [Candidatus Paceibacterota bacterium]
MANTEIVDIVDEDNSVVGSASVAEAHDKRLLHRVVGVFVFDIGGSLYLQTSNKYGRLDLSVGGHVQQGETYEEAARREMLEEIGLKVPIQHVVTFLPANAKLGHYWGLFTATAPEGWQFEATEEVSSLSRFDIDAIKQKMKSNPNTFTHGSMNVMTELIRVKNL